jgi:hypothetical protein
VIRPDAGSAGPEAGTGPRRLPDGMITCRVASRPDRQPQLSTRH